MTVLQNGCILKNKQKKSPQCKSVSGLHLLCSIYNSGVAFCSGGAIGPLRQWGQGTTATSVHPIAAPQDFRVSMYTLWWFIRKVDWQRIFIYSGPLAWRPAPVDHINPYGFSGCSVYRIQCIHNRATNGCSQHWHLFNPILRGCNIQTRLIRVSTVCIQSCRFHINGENQNAGSPCSHLCLSPFQQGSSIFDGSLIALFLSSKILIQKLDGYCYKSQGCAAIMPNSKKIVHSLGNSFCGINF